MKAFSVIKTLIPFLMLLATHRGESLYIPRDDPLSAPVKSYTYEQDGCANIHNTFKAAGKKNGVSFSFSDVKSCYESFAFDDQRRTDTIDTMKKLLNGFYAFADQAKEQPVQGFDFKPLDIISEFDNLKQKQYANDFEFSMDATNLVTELKDPHTLFFPICYTRFTFTQKLTLYAAASEDGTHKIKVFKDIAETGNDDCEVERIDGVPALDLITEFARNKVFVSKDLGVRLNMALATLSLQNGNYLLNPRSSQFNLRLVLPEKESTTFDLKCGANTKTITRNWEAFVNNPDDLDLFTDADSYWKNFCANPPAIESSFPQPKTPDVPPVRNEPKRNNNSGNSNRKHRKVRSRSGRKHHDHCNVAYPANPLGLNQDLITEFSPSVKPGKLVFDAKIAQFFILENNVGVAAIATFDLLEVSVETISQTFTNLQIGFKTLADNGATKLVLDLSNNEGGLVILSHFVNSLLFPNENPSLPTDFRLNDLIKRAVVKASSSPELVNSIFHTGGYLGVDQQPFNNTDEFFASKFVENDLSNINGFLAASQAPSFPWKSTDMIILTNGFCGSACASTSLLFSELHGVKSVAVGGFPNVPLSFTSFPGGQVFILDDFLKRGFDLKTDFTSLGLENDTEFPKDIPTNTVLTFSVRRSFNIVNTNEILEYSFKPSTNQISYNEENIRDPSKLWSQASTLI